MEITESLILEKIREHFPYKEIREEQKTAIMFAIRTFLSGKKFALIEAGTGVGKSAIGYTVSKVWGDISQIVSVDKESETTPKRAWFLTTQKVLQEQYERDFKDMKSLYSARNYPCNSRKGLSCGDAMKIFRNEDANIPNACKGLNCMYRGEKVAFISRDESVTNFNFFLTENKFVGKFLQRRLLVIDEAHNTEDVLTAFSEMTISQHFNDKVVGATWPEKVTPAKFVKWLEEEYHPKVQGKILFFQQKLDEMKISDSLMDQLKALAMKFDAIKSHEAKLRAFLDSYDPDNWVIEAEEMSEKNVKVVFKPIDVSPFAKHLFAMGDKVLFMSATLLSQETFAKSLGISENDYGYISIPSPFPVSNRPFHIVDIGSMSKDSIDSTLPKLVRAVEAILDAHPLEKGIIHASTYKIAGYITSNIGKKYKSRLISHSSEDRDDALRKHLASGKPTVLLSPSMTEGVDLKEDLSRFQIMCKIPYPFLGDKIVRKRMAKNSKWYGMKTAITILQSVGRSVRSSTDRADTYVLDSDWNKFFTSNRDCFSSDFIKTIKR